MMILPYDDDHQHHHYHQPLGQVYKNLIQLDLITNNDDVLNLLRLFNSIQF